MTSVSQYNTYCGRPPISVTHSEIAATFHPTLNGILQAENIIYGSQRKHWWLCPNGTFEIPHEYEAVVASRTGGRGCPFCAGRKVLAGFNDLAATHSELASEWSARNTSLPEEVTSGVKKKVIWCCSLGHEWKAPVFARTVKRFPMSCPYCSNNRVLIGFNDLETTHPHLVPEWSPGNDKTPTEVMAGGNKDFWWICLKDSEHRWRASTQRRAVRGRGCPECSHKISKPEKEVAGYVRVLLPGREILTSDRTVIHPKELDIYIPSLQKAIEFNGTWFHSLRFRPADHREVKTQLASEQGVSLLHVEEADYRTDLESVQKEIRMFLQE